MIPFVLAAALAAPPHLQDGDAAISVGDTWIYADTFEGATFVHSDAVVDGVVVPGQLIPNVGSTYYWPEAAAPIGHHDILVTLTAGYSPSDVAAVVSDAGAFVRFVPWTAGTAGLTRVGDSLVAYSTSAPGPNLGRTVSQATVPITDIGQPFTVTEQATAITDADTTVSVWHDTTGFHAMTLQDGPYGSGVVEEYTAHHRGFHVPSVATVATGWGYVKGGQVHYNVEHHDDGWTINNNWIDGVLHPAATYAPTWKESS